MKPLIRKWQAWRWVWAAIASASAFTVQALPVEDIDHLMGRVAFAARPADYERLASLDREAAVQLLLAEGRGTAWEAPDWAQPPWHPAYWQQQPLQLPGETRPAKYYWAATRVWLLNQLLAAESPLQARLLLHWHGYFPIIRQKHAASALRRDQALYQQALGDYRQVLRTFARSGATMENLDLKQNRRGAINENFARELLELYTLGRGHYQESDVRETARAFTGWAVHRTTGLFIPLWHRHDFGPKTILGRTGRWTGDDALEMLFEHPRFAEHQVERLWRNFISPDPDPGQVRSWAQQFRQDQYDLRQLLRRMLVSDAFWAAQHRQALVRSPVELVVGELRAAGVVGDYGVWMDLWARQMGQQLYLAPDVKGWRGHTEWLSMGTIGARQAFIAGMHSGFDAGIYGRFVDGAYLAPYSIAQAHADSARLWQAVELARNQRPAAMMATEMMRTREADLALRNLK